jgi:hypothetical protein
MTFKEIILFVKKKITSGLTFILLRIAAYGASKTPYTTGLLMEVG